MIRSRQHRTGYTLIELIVVLAVLTIIGAVLIPTLSGLRRDTRTKAGVDLVRGMMADARGNAMVTGLNYRLSMSADGKKLRVAPELLDTTGELPASVGSPPAAREEDMPTGVTLVPLDDDPLPPDANGWTPIVTVLNDGTCRDDLVELKVVEAGTQPVVVRIRGLTGAVDVVRPNSGGVAR